MGSIAPACAAGEGLPVRLPNMPTPQEVIERYAALVVEVGANVQPGQDVVVTADISHAPIARAVAERAYVVGARRVTVEYADACVRRSALLHAPDQTVVAARTFLQAPPAASTAVPDVVDAFESSLETLTGELAGWVLASGDEHQRGHGSGD